MEKTKKTLRMFKVFNNYLIHVEICINNHIYTLIYFVSMG